MYFNPVYSGNYVFDAFKFQTQLYTNMINEFYPEKTDLEVSKLVSEVMNDSYAVELIKVGDQIFTIDINQYKMAVSQMIYYDEWKELGSMNSDMWFEEDIKFEKSDGHFIPSSDVGIDVSKDATAVYKDYFFVSSKTQRLYKEDNPELFNDDGEYIGTLPEDK